VHAHGCFNFFTDREHCGRLRGRAVQHGDRQEDWLPDEEHPVHAHQRQAGHHRRRPDDQQVRH